MHGADSLADAGVPAVPGEGFLQFPQTTGRVEQLRIEMGHPGVGVVEDGAEHGVALQPGRRVAEDQVDSPGGGGDIVGEKAKACQTASVFHSRFQELIDLPRREREIPGYGQPVVHVDAETIGRDNQRPLFENRPRGVIDRGLGVERLTAPQSGHGED